MVDGGGWLMGRGQSNIKLIGQHCLQNLFSNLGTSIKLM